MLRLASALTVLAACGFQGPGDGAPAGDASGGTAADSGSGGGSGGTCAGDADADGVCDADDDWPCGARPSAPEDGNGGDLDANWSAADLDVASTSDSLAVVAADTPFTIDLLYRIYVECPGGADAECTTQLELGTDETLLACATSVTTENDEVRLRIGSAAATVQLPARATPYPIRLNLGVAQTSCAASYTDGAPDSATIALVCVR